MDQLNTLRRWSGRPGPLLLLTSLAVLLVMLAMSEYWRDRMPPTQGSFASALPLTHQYQESPTAFVFSYPEGWLYNIPQYNTLIIGPEALFQMEPSPSVVVQRNLGLISEESLAAMLDTYLRRGPLHGNHAWLIIDEPYETRLSGRPAWSIALQGRDLAAIESEELHVQITVTQADNLMVYILVVTTPVAQRQQHANTLAAILASVEIRE